MLRASLPLLLTLSLSWLFPRGSNDSCPPAWATLVWDVPPLEREQEQEGTAQSKIAATEVVFSSISVLCVTLLGFYLGLLLLRVARSCQRKVTPPEKTCQDGSCCKSYRLMRRLKEDPQLMERFCKHLINCRISYQDAEQAREKEKRQKLGRGDDIHSQLQQGSKEDKKLLGME